MPPAARVTDMHVCPMVTGVVPHVGGPIMPPGVPTVLIDFLPAATVTNMLTCVGPPDMIVKGSAGVFINFLPAARLGDQTAHGGVIVMGAPNVIIGEIGSPSPGAGGLGGIVAGLAVSGVSNPVEAIPSIEAQGRGGPPAGPVLAGTMIFKNMLPDALEAEIAEMEALGITPISPGDPGFAELANSGQMNWVATADGELLVAPAIDGVTHAAIAGGADVVGAGTADVAVGGGESVLVDITAQTGHYLGAEATAVESETAIEAGVALFEEYGIFLLAL